MKTEEKTAHGTRGGQIHPLPVSAEAANAELRSSAGTIGPQACLLSGLYRKAFRVLQSTKGRKPGTGTAQERVSTWAASARKALPPSGTWETQVRTTCSACPQTTGVKKRRMPGAARMESSWNPQVAGRQGTTKPRL